MAPTKNPSYTPADLENAIEEVRNCVSYYKASKKYSIPKTTLIYKFTEKTPLTRKMGPETILTLDEEKTLVKWLFHLQNRGFPASKSCLLDSVQILIKDLKRKTPFTNDRPGRKWYEAFMRRNPELSVRVSQNLTNARSSVTKDKLQSWFLEVENYFTENFLLDAISDGSRVFNL
uniref:HTH CENPB-type domain-containing protein n=1 Tax=Photinus pyralis TaxID=7054 RepID=A0A1Y1NE15_PHOPY